MSRMSIHKQHWEGKCHILTGKSALESTTGVNGNCDAHFNSASLYTSRVCVCVATQRYTAFSAGQTHILSIHFSHMNVSRNGKAIRKYSRQNLQTVTKISCFVDIHTHKICSKTGWIVLQLLHKLQDSWFLIAEDWMMSEDEDVCGSFWGVDNKNVQGRLP